MDGFCSIRGLRLVRAAALAALLGFCSAAAAGAQSPFGIGMPETSGSGVPFMGGMFGWIAAHQAAFYQSITDSLGRLRAEGGTAWLLAAVSFVYGVIHAAGPGHGKAVVSAYVIASAETARHGVLIAFVSALVQAVVAIAIVSVLSVLLRATAMTMTRVANWTEIVSYGLIAVAGAWILVRRFIGRGQSHALASAVGAGSQPVGHVHDPSCRHGCGLTLTPPPQAARSFRAEKVAPPSLAESLRRAAGTILAVGVRPCSGALIILVFALSQGLFAAGVASVILMALGTGLTVAAVAALTATSRDLALRVAGRETRTATRIAGVLEVSAGLVIFSFGLVLLGGSVMRLAA